MIRGLRARHRWTFAGLALALPIGLGLALSSRSSVPASAPRAEAAVALPNAAPASDAIVKSGQAEMRVRVWNSGADGARVIELSPKQDLESPDVLVYWSESDARDALPPNAILLGSLAGIQQRRFALSKSVHGGRLYLYSLAHQELVASLEFER